ncbi:hypothetical protein [Lacticaseibacillus rhamnosus]|uniref:hypothetical protein n=1 Tax=Lacticaseibacillus rhamnosus TaxID=47715 RepID=UPI0007E18943|nr:hypothetical protein [Lacticaseibacillus rhamnosus]OAU76067.1 hypothetical protein PY62_10100 [Lacticaseibacillus rhamnosus]
MTKEKNRTGFKVVRHPNTGQLQKVSDEIVASYEQHLALTHTDNEFYNSEHLNIATGLLYAIVRLRAILTHEDEEVER